MLWALLLLVACDRGGELWSDLPPLPCRAGAYGETPVFCDQTYVGTVPEDGASFAESVPSGIAQRVLLACTSGGGPLSVADGQTLVGAAYLTLACAGDPSVYRSDSFFTGHFRSQALDDGLVLVRLSTHHPHGSEIIARIGGIHQTDLAIENAESLLAPRDRPSMPPAFSSQLGWILEGLRPSVSGPCMRVEIRGHTTVGWTTERVFRERGVELREGQSCTLSGAVLLAPAEGIPASSSATRDDADTNQTARHADSGLHEDAGPPQAPCDGSGSTTEPEADAGPACSCEE
jgi:hypothetical protein